MEKITFTLAGRNEEMAADNWMCKRKKKQLCKNNKFKFDRRLLDCIFWGNNLPFLLVARQPLAPVTEHIMPLLLENVAFFPPIIDSAVYLQLTIASFSITIPTVFKLFKKTNKVFFLMLSVIITVWKTTDCPGFVCLLLLFLNCNKQHRKK